MKDYSTFVAPKLTAEFIRARADEFRLRFGKGHIPVDIEDIVEFDLGIQIMPKTDLYRMARVDATLTPDCKMIHVDYERYMTQPDRFLKRLRYSIAHEIGHLELHQSIIAAFRPETPEEWKSMIRTIPEEEYRWCEYHAYEFAGRLLVPREDLRDEMNAKRADMDRVYDAGVPSDLILDRFSESLAGRYNVSGEVISRRLRFERLWPYPLEPLSP